MVKKEKHSQRTDEGHSVIGFPGEGLLVEKKISSRGARARGGVKLKGGGLSRADLETNIARGTISCSRSEGS